MTTCVFWKWWIFALIRDARDPVWNEYFDLRAYPTINTSVSDLKDDSFGRKMILLLKNDAFWWFSTDKWWLFDRKWRFFHQNMMICCWKMMLLVQVARRDLGERQLSARRAVNCAWLLAPCLKLATCYLLLATCNLQLATCNLAPCYLSLATRGGTEHDKARLESYVNSQLVERGACHLLRVACYLLLVACCLLLGAWCLVLGAW